MRYTFFIQTWKTVWRKYNFLLFDNCANFDYNSSIFVKREGECIAFYSEIKRVI